MVGGGQDAFIGNVHRMAAALDGQITLVAGAFSSDAEKSKSFGKSLFLDSERVYGSYSEMIHTEKGLPVDTRIDFVSIVTPNHMHFGPAKMALENGFHVVCDKPLSFSLDEAEELCALVEKSGLLFCLTHNYTGYPMVKQARDMVRNGAIGNVRKIDVQYNQGWLTTPLESTNQKQASWRTDPNKSGIAGAMGDLGTHAESLVEYICGITITELSATLRKTVEGRKLDDDGHIIVKYSNGASGVLTASQIAAGEENKLTIQIYGDKGGLTWNQMYPNNLTLKWLDQPTQVYRTGVGDLCPSAQAHTRLPAGHPEGYIEAFANIYRNFATCLQAKIDGTDVNPIYDDYPTVQDGLRGMKFIETVIASSENHSAWTAF